MEEGTGGDQNEAKRTARTERGEIKSKRQKDNARNRIKKDRSKTRRKKNEPRPPQTLIFFSSPPSSSPSLFTPADFAAAISANLAFFSLAILNLSSFSCSGV